MRWRSGAGAGPALAIDLGMFRVDSVAAGSDTGRTAVAAFGRPAGVRRLVLADRLRDLRSISAPEAITNPVHHGGDRVPEKRCDDEQDQAGTGDREHRPEGTLYQELPHRDQFPHACAAEPRR